MSYFENGAGERLPRFKEFMASMYQNTWCYTSELAPITTLLTYDFEKFQHMHMHMLAKLVFAVGEESVWLDPETAPDTVTTKIPGGLCSVCTVNGKPFELETRPIIIERSSVEHCGGMAVRARYGGRIRARVCGGRFIHAMSTLMTVEHGFDLFKMDGTAVPAQYEAGEGIIINSENNGFTVAVKADGEARYSFDHEWGYIESDSNQLDILLTFTTKDTPELMPKGTACGFFEASRKHYGEIYKNWEIKTGEEDIDYAFECARFHLEEAYFEPMGWSESMHHWVSFWHPEFTPAEEWGGNSERTKAYLEYAFEHLENGNKGQDFTPSGHSELHWGGENPYLFRSIDHYLKMTADKDFARYAIPYMERILEQTFNEYDPGNTDIMGFGCQLGNQEDFEGIPGMGAASGLEGVQMLKTMALAYKMNGDDSKAALLEGCAQRSARQIYKRLWQSDLGFFAWYEDLCGNKRLEPSYLGFCYPAVYNAVPEEDMVTGIDQMMHRLMGDEGEVYMSNHFGGHAKNGVATWGMQCGSNNQVMPAMAMARVAENNQAIRPLRFVASDVRYFGGYFPETHGEPFKTGFVASAALYAQAIIESIYGIKRDLISSTTVISPCFPDAWEDPSIKLGGIDIKFTNKSGAFEAKGYINDGTRKSFVLRTKPCKNVKAVLDGKEVAAKVSKHPGWYELCLELGEVQSFDIKLTFEVINVSVPTVCAAVGDSVIIRPEGARVIGVKDRCGIFSAIKTGDALEASIKQDLLDKYEKFGWHGLINFARRKYFLTLEACGEVFELPAVITVLPKVALNASYDAGKLTLTAVSNLNISHDECAILFAGERLDAKIIDSKAEFSFSEDQKKALTLMSNTAKVLIADATYDVTFNVSEKDASERFKYTALELDKDKLKGPEYWNTIGRIATAPDSTIYCVTPENILADVLEQYKTIAYGGVSFDIAGGFLPVDSRIDPQIRMDLRGKNAQKVYLLVAAFITNQHVFSTPLIAELEAERGSSYFRPIKRVPLSFPGDLDIGLSGRGMYGFPSYVDPEHCKRGILPPLPTLADEDYPDSRAPEFPQHYLWNKRPAFEVNETVFTVIELGFDKTVPLKELRLTVTDDMTGLAVYGVTLCGDPEQKISKGDYVAPGMPDFS